MTMSPYCSLAMQNNPRPTIQSLYLKTREMMEKKGIRFTIPSNGHPELLSKIFARQAMATLTLASLIEAWKRYNSTTRNFPTDHQEVVKKINSGDCGLMAILATHVLGQKYNINASISMNGEHCWINVEGKDFDTSKVDGYEPGAGANVQWSLNNACPLPDARVLSFEETCVEWMPCDTFGAYFIKGVCENYGITFPEALQHCIDNGDEYESPEAVAVYKAQAELVAKHN